MNRAQVTRREALGEPILIPDEYEKILRDMAHTFAVAGHGDTIKSVEVQVLPGIASVVSQLLTQASRTRCLGIVDMDQALSTFQASKMLGVSRPFLIASILDKGLIPYERVGIRKDRRIKMQDLQAFKRMRAAQRSQALDELAQMNAEFIITSIDSEEEE